jgi:hypothetical protein
MTSSFSRRQRFSLVESCSLVCIAREKTQGSHYRLAIANAIDSVKVEIGFTTGAPRTQVSSCT